MATHHWGATSVTKRQIYTVENSDVGSSRHNYLGINHAEYGGDDHERAQLRWIEAVTADGGDAAFCSGEGTL
jgi:hypothetical protein